jgi:predicted nucleic acid-binding protein
MNDNKIFLDTNLWVYPYSNNSPVKTQKVKQIIATHYHHLMVSTQVLGELYHVLTRKNIQTHAAAKEIIVITIATFPVSEVGTLMVVKALELRDHYNYSYWDSLLIATALLNDCQQLYSEDMQHDQLIENKIRIINPFRMCMVPK